MPIDFHISITILRTLPQDDGSFFISTASLSSLLSPQVQSLHALRFFLSVMSHAEMTKINYKLMAYFGNYIL